MTATAIAVENLWKVYCVYLSSGGRLREWLTLGRVKAHQRVEALRGVSFTVESGVFMGLLGPNGSGKTTLLRVLAGLSPPTSGTARVVGRRAALIALGAGFHQDFTGADNIRIAAMLFGLTPDEVEDRFVPIAEFSELGEALQRPIRTYSQGMLLRLGFSVAAAVDPDVLLVDEVLSVGDLAFQKKCVDRFHEFRERKKTILFATHDFVVAAKLARECLWIDLGRIRLRDRSESVARAYESHALGRERREPESDERGLRVREKTVATAPLPDGHPEVLDMTLLDDAASSCTLFPTGSGMTVRVRYHLHGRAVTRCGLGVLIHRNDRLLLHLTGSRTCAHELAPDPEGLGETWLWYPSLPLMPGRYTVSVHLMDEETMYIYDRRDFALEFEVPSSDRFDYGLVRLTTRWKNL